MRIHKLYIVIGLIIAFAALFELSAHATEINKSSTTTLSGSVYISAGLLPSSTSR